MQDHSFRKIVTLGGTGFIGKALHSSFKNNRHLELHDYSSSDLDLRRRESLNLLTPVTDNQTLLFLVSGIKLERGDSMDSFHDNILIGENVARFLQSHPVGKCVFFSTVSVYGDEETNLSLNESTPVKPNSLYGIAKITIENLLKQVADEKRFPLLTLRLCRVYGFGDPYAKYGITKFMDSILNSKEVQIYGEGRELRDHLYIDDLVRLTHHLAFGPFDGTYNIATGESRSYLKILEALKETLPVKFTVSHAPRSRKLIDQRFDISKLKKSAPDFHFTPLEATLKEMYNLTQQGSHDQKQSNKTALN